MNDGFPTLSWQQFSGAFQQLTLSSVLDISIVSVLIYFALLWFRRAKAMRVGLGFMTLGVIYLVAGQIGMTLTTSLFKGIFTIFLLSMVSIFQEDLRRFFEKVSFWKSEATLFRRRTLDPLLDTTMKFSRARIGALIVLKGRDPLDRHLDGGHPLGGQISAALLDSLFDPHSDGHDGAVIIEGELVTQFGVHLPLSRNIDPRSGLGTRHSAALGLSELCDSLCIAVSEQKGTISVARDGHLSIYTKRMEVEQDIEKFLAHKRLAPHYAQKKWTALFRHPVEKILAILLGLLLWLLLVQGFRPARKAFSVTVHPQNCPTTLRVENVTPTEVFITLAGLERDFSDKNPRFLKAFIDLSEMHIGNHEIELTAENFNLPPSLKVIEIIPQTITVSLVPIPKAPSPVLKAWTAPIPAIKKRKAWLFWKSDE